MKGSRLAILAALVSLSIAACAPAGRPSDQGPGAQQSSSFDRTLVAVQRAEPKSIALRPLLGQSFEGFGVPKRLFNADLALLDDHDNAQPYLAEALPKLNTDTWRVFPDGRMETTWKLKPNVVWHDGAAFSAEDLVFAWQVYTKKELGTGNVLPFLAIQDVAAPDEGTLVIRWRQPYPEAGQMVGDRDLPALPRHLLESAVQDLDPTTFTNSSYWTRDYVGLGPYRINQWEAGSFLEGVAFDQHVLGRPKIGRITVRFISDWDTALANILAGQVHFVDSAITVEQAVQLQRDWVSQGAGSIAWDPNLFRSVFFQHRPELATPQTILDPRVRRALASSIDKQAISDTIYLGAYPVADFMMLPTSKWGQSLAAAVQKYPYDPRHSEQIMNEAGFTRGTDGFFASPAERFVAENKVTAGFEADTLAIVSEWRKAGFDVQSAVLPSAASLDPAQRVTYPAMYTASTPHGEVALSSYTTAQIPKAENNWRGGANRGGWSNAEYDRLVDAFNTTLEPRERATQVGQIAKVFTDQLPMIPVVFVTQPYVWVAALQGIVPESAENDIAWNIHEWELP